MQKRGKLNIITGVFHQVLNTALGLVLPYLFLVNYGSETNGLISSVGQLFTCLALLEAGVGAASLQALYKPVAEQDRDSISAILSATNKYYKKTGIIYLACIAVLCAGYPYFVESALSDTTIRLVILFQGAGAVVGYFIQAKYNCLFRAEGKNYLLNCILILETIVKNFGKIIAIRLGYGIVMVQVVQFVTLALEAVFISTYVRKKYSWLDLRKLPNYQAIAQKNAVLVQSVAWMVFNHTDILILTFFAKDFKLVSVYSVYLLVFEAIQNVTNTIRIGLQFRIGRAALDSPDQFAEHYRKYSAVISAVSSCLFVITYLLAAPFVGIYTGGTTDANYLLRFLPELFFAYKFIYSFRAMNRQVVEVTGRFADTKHIAVWEACINLGVSMLLVFRFDIYGVLIGSIAALLYSTVAYIRFIEKEHFMGQKKFLMKQIFINAIPAVAAIAMNQWVSIQASGYGMLILKGMAVVLCAAAVYALVCSFMLKRR